VFDEQRLTLRASLVRMLNKRSRGMVRARKIQRLVIAARAVAVLSLSVVWGSGAPAARGASVRPFVPRTVVFSSDGSRYVAWQTRISGPTILYDTRTGRRTDIGMPQGCELAAEEPQGFGVDAAAGRFLVTCGKQSEGFYDVRSGLVTRLPSGFPWLRFGSRYVEGSDEHACPQSRAEREHQLCRALYDIATGAVSERPDWQWPDLGRPGAPTACGRLRRILLPEAALAPEGGELVSPRGVSYNDGLLATASSRPGAVRLVRCNGHTTVLAARGEPVDFELRGGLLTWDTGHLAGEFDAGERGEGDISRGRIWSYKLHSRSRQSWTLPRLPLILHTYPPRVGVFGWSTHTSNTVFWVAPLELERGERELVGASAIYIGHVH
jgi:hypothetical protein